MTHAPTAASAFAEDLHPRAPSGSSTGGQFSSGDSTPAKTTTKPAKKAAPAATTPKRRPVQRRQIPKGQLGFDGLRGTGYGLLHGDARVRSLQAELNRLGLTDSRGRKLAVDGKLGPLTTQSIKAAQRRLGMNPTGIIAEAFIARLKASKSLPPAKTAPRKRVKAKYNPAELRNPDGKWTESPGEAIRDALKLAGRIDLLEGDSLTGSGLLRTEDGQSFPMAWLHTPDGTRLRLGVGIPEEDDHKWAAADFGGTVELDEAGVRKLAEATETMRAAGRDTERRLAEIDDKLDKLRAHQRELIRRQYPDLPKSAAKKLDKIDENIDDIERRLGSLESSNETGFAELPEAAKGRWREIDAQIERLKADNRKLYHAYWADESDTGLLDRAKQTTLQIEDLLEEQAQLHGQRETSGSLVGYASLYKQRRAKIERLQEQLEAALAQHEELAGRRVRLSAADEAQLLDTNAKLDAVEAEALDLEDAEVASGEIPAEWGDIVYRTVTTDVGVQHRIGIRPPFADDGWDIGDLDEDSRDPVAGPTDAELAELARMLRAGPSSAVKASAAEVDDSPLHVFDNGICTTCEGGA